MAKGKKKGRKRGKRAAKSQGMGKGAPAGTGSCLIPNDHSPVFRERLAKAALARNLNPFPASMRVVFNTTTSGVVAAAAAASAGFYVCLNSPFLPFNTAAGFPAPLTAHNANAPAGYGQLLSATGPYTTYRVVGGACHVEWAPSNSLDAQQITMAPMTASFGTYTKAARSRYAVTTTAAAADGIAKLTNSTATALQTGDSLDAITNQAGFAALYNAYPGVLFFWELWYATGDAAVLTGNVDYRVNVTFDTILENPQYDQALLDAVSTDEEKLALPLHEIKVAARKKREKEIAQSLDDEARRTLLSRLSSKGSASQEKKDQGEEGGSKGSSSSLSSVSAVSKLKGFAW